MDNPFPSPLGIGAAMPLARLWRPRRDRRSSQL